MKALSAEHHGLLETAEPGDEIDAEFDAGADLDAFRPANGHVRRLAGPVEPRRPDFATLGTGRDPMSTGAARDPWYASVLQIWGIAFLAWAGILLLRSLYLTLFASRTNGDDAGVLTTVVAAVLLVLGAAGLFLLVDLGRYVRGLQPARVDRPFSWPNVTLRSLTPKSWRFWRPRRTSIHLQSP